MTGIYLFSVSKFVHGADQISLQRIQRNKLNPQWCAVMMMSILLTVDRMNGEAATVYMG